jgi:Rod binding domain-containing protein
MEISPHQALKTPPPVDAKLKQVARQFEGIFLQELFKGLEKEPEEGDLLGDSQASQTFSQLHHQALSDQAAGGMGIADLLYRDLLAKKGAAAAVPVVPGGH